MSIGVLNEGRELSPDYRRVVDRTWLGARVGIAVEAEGGQEALRAWYTAIGTRLHPGGQPNEIATMRASLVDIGADPALADAGLDDRADDALRASHREGVEPVGADVGTPIIRINQMSLFGPVMSPAPKGEAAGRLFDAFAVVTAEPGFFELKRTRTREPIFD